MSKVSKKLTKVPPMENENIKDGLRQLLLLLQPVISASGNSANVRGMLLSLEDFQDDFNELLLVKWIHSKLQDCIEDIVGQEIDKICQREGMTITKMKFLAPKVLQEVMGTTEVRACLGVLKKTMALVVEEFRKDLDFEVEEVARRQSSTKMDPEDLVIWRSEGKPAFERTYSGSESLSSTWSNPNFAFLQPQQYAEIANNLNRFSPTESRLEALNMLLMSPLVDVVNCTHWPKIKEGLKCGLTEANPEVFCPSYKLHARLLGNLTPFSVSEAFDNVSSAIRCIYSDKRVGGLPSVSSGIQGKKKSHMQLMQLFHLMVESARLLPKFWIRYPPNLVANIINATLSVLDCSLATKNLILPIQLTALVDPMASWMKSWLHGHYSRNMFFKSLRNFGQVWAFVVQNLGFGINEITSEEWKLAKNSFRSSAKGKGTISATLVSYASWQWSVQVFTCLMNYEESRDILQKGQKLERILTGMMSFISKRHDINTREASGLLTTCLIDNIEKSDWCARSYRLHLGTLLQPLRTWSKNSFNTDIMPIHVIENCLKIISAFLPLEPDSSEESIRFLFHLCSNAISNSSSLSNYEQILVLILGISSCICDRPWPRFYDQHLELMAALDEYHSQLQEPDNTPTNSMTNLNLDCYNSGMLHHKSRISLVSNFLANPATLLLYQLEWQSLESILQKQWGGISDENMTTFLPALARRKDLGKPILQLFVHQTSKNPQCGNKAKSSRRILILGQCLLSHQFMMENVVEEEMSKSLDLFPSLILEGRNQDEVKTYWIEAATSNLENLCFLEWQYQVTEKLDQLGVEASRVWDKVNMNTTPRMAQVKRKNEDKAVLNKLHGLHKLLTKNPSTLSRELSKQMVITNLPFLPSLVKASMWREAFGVILDILELEPNQEKQKKHPDHQEIPEHMLKKAALILGKAAPKEISVTTESMEQIFVYIQKQLGEARSSSIPWFAQVILMLTGGNVEFCKKLLQRILKQENSWYIWNQHQSFNIVISRVDDICSQEMASLYFNLKYKGFSIAIITLNWLEKCFWGTMPLSEVGKHILYTLLFGPSYTVFTCMSLWKHLESKITELQTLDLNFFLNPINNFRQEDYQEFYKDLYAKYGENFLA